MAIECQAHIGAQLEQRQNYAQEIMGSQRKRTTADQGNQESLNGGGDLCATFHGRDKFLLGRQAGTAF